MAKSRAHSPAGDREPGEGEMDSAGQKGDPWRSGLRDLRLVGGKLKGRSGAQGDTSPVGTGVGGASCPKCFYFLSEVRESGWGCGKLRGEV